MVRWMLGYFVPGGILILYWSTIVPWLRWPIIVGMVLNLWTAGTVRTAHRYAIRDHLGDEAVERPAEFDLALATMAANKDSVVRFWTIANAGVVLATFVTAIAALFS